MPLPSAITTASAGTVGVVSGGNVISLHETDRGGVTAVLRGGGGTTAGGFTKENDGCSRQRRRRVLLVKIAVYASLILMGYNLLWTYWLAGVNIPDVEYDKITGKARTRRKPNLQMKHDPVRNKDVYADPLDGILEGHLTLVDIELPDPVTGGLVVPSAKAGAADPAPYKGVTATFCHISWQLQRKQPKSVPLFSDLQRESALCQATTVRKDLLDVTRKARLFDAGGKLDFAAVKPKHPTRSTPPTAVIFHESRAGSTLIASVLAAFAPERTRVYAEVPAATRAVLACEQLERRKEQILKQGGFAAAKTRDEVCHPTAHHAVIRDVFYLLGRTAMSTKPQYVFYKMSSLATTALSDFVKAMPSTPWAFNFRDPVEVLMSHFRHHLTGHNMAANHRPACLRSYMQDRQSEAFEATVQEKGRTVSSLSMEEFCAVHLATLCAAAVKEFETSGNEAALHWFFSYKELPFAVWEYLLPKVAGGFLTHDAIHNMQDVSKVYIKGGTGNSDSQQEWQEDSTVKQSKATPKIKKAADTWLSDVYKKMEDIRQDLEKRYKVGGT